MFLRSRCRIFVRKVSLPDAPCTARLQQLGFFNVKYLSIVSCLVFFCQEHKRPRLVLVVRVHFKATHFFPLGCIVGFHRQLKSGRHSSQ